MERPSRHHPAPISLIRNRRNREFVLMKKSTRVLALAGLLTAGAAAPAMATWVPVTAVPLDSRPTIDVVDASRELPTRVEALSITAHNSDVACSNVTGFFRDGQTMQLFHGILPAGREN